MKPTTHALLQLHTAVLLAGFTGVLGKLIQLHEAWLVWYRMLFTVLALLLMAFVMRRSLRLPSLLQWQLMGVGAIIALHWLFFYGSIRYGNVSVALVCFAATSAFTAFLEPLLLKRAFRSWELLMAMMVLTGIYFIFHFDTSYRTGIAFGIVSSMLSALFPVLNKKLVQQVPSDVLSFYELGGGFILLSLLLPFYLQATPAGNALPTAWDIIWLLVLSLLCTVWAFQLSVKALLYISPFTVNLSYNLEPLYGILLAFIIFKEHTLMGKGFFMGATLILITLILHTWKSQLAKQSAEKTA